MDLYIMAYFLCCFESEAMSSSDVIWIIICGRTSTVNLKIYICVYYKFALVEESVGLRNSGSNTIFLSCISYDSFMKYFEQNS